MGRVLDWSACWNVRDLGGYPTRRGMTQYGRVIRAGNLSKLTEAGRGAIRAAGVHTVIDLRDPRELEMELNPFHASGRWPGDLSYVNVPLISDANWKAIKDPVLRARGYELIVELSAENVGKVMSAIASADIGPVVIHCHAGKERTGLIAALLLELAGVSEQAICADYIASDEHLQPLYEEWSMHEPDPEKRAAKRASFTSDAEDIIAPLQYVRSHGGIRSYLRDAGTSDDEVDELEHRLVDPELAMAT